MADPVVRPEFDEDKFVSIMKTDIVRKDAERCTRGRLTRAYQALVVLCCRRQS